MGKVFKSSLHQKIFKNPVFYFSAFFFFFKFTNPCTYQRQVEIENQYAQDFDKTLEKYAVRIEEMFSKYPRTNVWTQML